MDVRTENPTLRTFYVRWIESKAKALKASTLVDYKLTFRLHILPSLGDVKLREITPGDIQEWIDALNLRATSANKTYRYLRACLNNAEAQGVIDRCPCRGINLPKVEREEFDLLTVEGVNRLIEAADEPERTLFATLAYAGLRLGEGLGLKWKDIDFHKNCIRVERTWGQFGWLVVWRRLVR